MLTKLALTSPSGFSTKSTAPAARACTVAAAPSRVWALSITMGVACLAKMARVASAPFSPGMLKSMLITSGRSGDIGLQPEQTGAVA